MSEFELNGKQYKFEPLDGFVQFEIIRKLLPAAASFLPAFSTLAEAAQARAAQSDEPKQVKLIGLLSDPALTPHLEAAARGFAALSTEDTKFIINAAMASVYRKETTGWVAVWNADARRTMFSDIQWVEILRITQNVVGSFALPFLI